MNPDPLLYECGPRQIRELTIDALEAGLVPFIEGEPGVGKSSIVDQITIDFGLQKIDHRLSTSAPEDMTGLPSFVNGKATFSPFDLFPIEGTPVPPGKDGWVLFLDEFNAASKMVQAAAYKLILDRMVGQHKLHPRVKIVAAGNGLGDRAIVNSLSTAMQSRLSHLKMKVDVNEWLEDVAYKRNFDPRIIAYINYRPTELMDFRPDHNDKTFCCPRTWEFMHKLIKNKQFSLVKDASGNEVYSMDRKTPLYAGTISSGVAASFVQFTKVFHMLPNIGDIVSSPMSANIPQDGATKWAVVTHLIDKMDDNTFQPVTEYISRLGGDFRIMFFKNVQARKPEFKTHPAFRKAMVELSRYLHDA
jgi:hypothetical protein